MRISKVFLTRRNKISDKYLVVDFEVDVRTNGQFDNDPDPEKIGKCIKAAEEAFSEEWAKEDV